MFYLRLYLLVGKHLQKKKALSPRNDSFGVEFFQGKNIILGFLADRKDDYAKAIIERIDNIPNSSKNLKNH